VRRKGSGTLLESYERVYLEVFTGLSRRLITGFSFEGATIGPALLSAFFFFGEEMFGARLGTTGLCSMLMVISNRITCGGRVQKWSTVVQIREILPSLHNAVSMSLCEPKVKKVALHGMFN